MLNPDLISFRRIELSDLPLIYKWLHEPHVHEWYEKEQENTLQEIIEKYGKKVRREEPTDSFLVLYENNPAGYIQTSKVKDWPTFAAIVDNSQSAATVDVFIGNIEFIGKGFGSQSIKKFLKEVVFRYPGISTCYVDPEPENLRAIKSYEKVGFKYLKTVQINGEPALAYIMEIIKEDLA